MAQQQMSMQAFMTRFPQAVDEPERRLVLLKKELKMLRDVFDSIDQDGSGDIPLEEFMSANDKTAKGDYSTNSKFGPFQADMFMRMDTDGDGRVTWRELISLMYHKYGKSVIKEMLSWLDKKN